MNEASCVPLLHLAAGNRFGLVPAPELISTTLADVPGVFHASVRSPYGPSGGVGWSAEAACTAAIGEALERIAAASIALDPAPPKKRGDVYDFDRFNLFTYEQRLERKRANENYVEIHRSHTAYVQATRLSDGAIVAVPRALTTLSEADGIGIVTSNGLAAGSSLSNATLRGLQEIIERDALMSSWLHGVSCPRVVLPSELSDRLVGLDADLHVVDISPAYTDWSVAAVCGSLPWRGRKRIGMGSACRVESRDAIEKAFLEWTQASLFVGVQMSFDSLRAYDSANQVVSFEDHATYYSARPQEWDRLPFFSGPIQNAGAPKISHENNQGSDLELLDRAVEQLRKHNLEVLVVDLTTHDLRHLGVSVVRVLVPGLTAVNSDHRWPFLGGSTADVSFRFPSFRSIGLYPSPFPHPLG
jgi:ribosomal protein S12 methylthiotransferase accessory factor